MNLGGSDGVHNASFFLADEPLIKGNLYRKCHNVSHRRKFHEIAEATLFIYNGTTGDVNDAVTDLDFTWETPVSG